MTCQLMCPTPPCHAKRGGSSSLCFEGQTGSLGGSCHHVPYIIAVNSMFFKFEVAFGPCFSDCLQTIYVVALASRLSFDYQLECGFHPFKFLGFIKMKKNFLFPHYCPCNLCLADLHLPVESDCLHEFGVSGLQCVCNFASSTNCLVLT